jgi:hypothetical protein
MDAHENISIRAILEPPDDHPNKQLVSGERIPVVITLPGSFPWHEPWLGWKIADVVEEDAQ